MISVKKVENTRKTVPIGALNIGDWFLWGGGGIRQLVARVGTAHHAVRLLDGASTLTPEFFTTNINEPVTPVVVSLVDVRIEYHEKG